MWNVCLHSSHVDKVFNYRLEFLFAVVQKISSEKYAPIIELYWKNNPE